jgi:hypothetical protein
LIKSKAKNGSESFDRRLFLAACVIFKILNEPGAIGKIEA